MTLVDLTRSERLVLAGVLRFVLRFDALPGAERKRALAHAAEDLGLRAAEARYVERERAGYRDAARFLEATASEIDGLMEDVGREIPDDRALRERIDEVADEAVQVAIVRAVETVARYGGLSRTEALFLDWLCAAWRVPPVTE